jgi:hypothetical protein
MSAIYNESPLMTFLVQRAQLEHMLEELIGTCFCPSFSYSVRYKEYFETISPAQARRVVLMMCSPLLITREDIADCIRIPNCINGYLQVEDVPGSKIVRVQGVDIIQFEKKMVNSDQEVTGIVYIMNGLIDTDY